MLWLLVIMMVLVLLALIKAIIGPTIIDRLISINAITTLVSALILLFAFFHDDYGLVDVALVFMLCAFVGGLWILKTFAPGNWDPHLPEIKTIRPDTEDQTDVDSDI